MDNISIMKNETNIYTTYFKSQRNFNKKNFKFKNRNSNLPDKYIKFELFLESSYFIIVFI